jgi:hypothetical protein
MTSRAPAEGGLQPWKPLLKPLAVLVGYSAALLAACVAVYIRQLNTQGPDAQASAGMYAAGDAMLFISVFGSVALVPTGLGLYFLRPLRIFWNLLVVTVLALAATGPVCAVALELVRHLGSAPTFLQVLTALGVMRVLGSLLLAPAFLLSACLAPTRFPRWALLGATAVEGLVAAYAVVHWFIVPGLH